VHPRRSCTDAVGYACEMRIGIIAPPSCAVPPTGYGGTESVLDRLARGLTHLGHEVVLFTTGDSECPVERRWLYETSDPGTMGDLEREVRHVLAAYEALDDVDVVHDNTMLGLLRAPQFAPAPVVSTNHGPFAGVFADLYRAVMDRVAVVAISRHQASTAHGVRIAAVIHHGIDPEAFPIGHGDGGYFLFLGRMTPDKGAREAALAARAARLPLVMAAKMREPAERAYFDENVRPVLGGGVEYVGEVGHEQKLALLRDAIALVNPIRWPEPFGLVMIEAMACGTPVIASPLGAAPEIVRHAETGYLCRGHEDLVARMHEVAALERNVCRACVEHHFTTARMAREYAGLFERVAAPRLAA